MSGDALAGSSVGAENLLPDTFSNLARLNGLVSGKIDGLSSSSSPNTKKRNLEEQALLTTVVGNLHRDSAAALSSGDAFCIFTGVSRHRSAEV